MKRWHLVLVLTCAALGGRSAGAQSLPIVRADAAGVMGWIGESHEVSTYDDWSGSFVASAIVGWYWTDHLKTEIDGTLSSGADWTSVTPVVVGNRTTWRVSHNEASTRRISVSQQYQVFRNAWFHPHVGAGLDLNWVTTRSTDEPVFVFDDATRQQRLVSEARTHSPATDLRLRPFAATGFKAYLSERAFFRSDVRLTFDRGIREVVLRFGFGADF